MYTTQMFVYTTDMVPAKYTCYCVIDELTRGKTSVKCWAELQQFGNIHDLFVMHLSFISFIWSRVLGNDFIELC